MRGKKAKALRRAVYGDQSLRTPRKYALKRKPHAERGAVVNMPGSLRAKYQQRKKEAIHAG